MPGIYSPKYEDLMPLPNWAGLRLVAHFGITSRMIYCLVASHYFIYIILTFFGNLKMMNIQFSASGPNQAKAKQNSDLEAYLPPTT